MVVNVRLGTAAMISDAYPGSVADIAVLRNHAVEVNAMLGESSLIVDKGYRGDCLVPGLTVVEDDACMRVRQQRALVEWLFCQFMSLFVFTVS